MTTKYIPLVSIDQIDEGLFKQTVDKHLAEVQNKLAAFRKEHGESAKGAKAKLVIEVGFVLKDPKTEVVECIAKSKYVLPVDPPSVSVMMAGESQTEEPCLLTRVSGSSSVPPRQGILATQDGRTVDQKTGEVK